MGTFDRLEIEIPPFCNQEGWQTKSLGCDMETYRITRDGILCGADGGPVREISSEIHFHNGNRKHYTACIDLSEMAGPGMFHVTSITDDDDVVVWEKNKMESYEFGSSTTTTRVERVGDGR